MKVTPRVATGAPPLLFVLFWNAFTAVHAFMLRGAWGSSALLFLLPFYALFFGVGLWMARPWWRGRSLRQRFGAPTLAALPAVLPGQSLQLAVEFDRDWVRRGSLDAQLRWVEVLARGSSGKTLGGSAGAGQRRSRPARHPLAGHGPGAAAALESLAPAPGTHAAAAGRGARQWLAPAVAAARSGARRRRDAAADAGAVATAGPRAGLDHDCVGGGGQLAAVCGADRGATGAVPAGVPGVLLLGASVVYELRQVLSRTLAAGPSSRGEMAERLKPFAATVRRRAQGFFVLSVLALLADMLGLLDKI